MSADVKKCHKNESGTTTTCEGRMSYPSVFRTNPKAKTKDGREKFTMSILFPPGSDLTQLKKDAEAAVVEEWGTNVPKNLKTPFLDAGEKVGEEFKGWILLRVSTMQKPAVVDARGAPVSEEAEVYPGRWCRISVRAGAYTQDMNKGVSFFLSNVQLLRNDDPLGGGRSNPENEFAPVEVDAGAPASGLFD